MKIEIGPSQASDIPALKTLWKQAFDDEDAFIDLFFREAYVPAGLFVLREDGRPVSMAAWFSMTFCRDRRGWPTAYVYAVATDEAARGRGYCRRLLDYMAGALSAIGIECLCLVPGSGELFDFYEKLGFSRGLTNETRQFMVSETDCAATAIEAPVYLTVREDFLAEMPYVSYPVPVLEYQKKAARLAGGDLFLLEDGAQTGCACASVQNGTAVLHELLWPGEPERGAALVCRALGVCRAQVRTPGTARDFAMVRWLRKPPIPAEGYLGLAFD